MKKIPVLFYIIMTLCCIPSQVQSFGLGSLFKDMYNSVAGEKKDSIDIDKLSDYTNIIVAEFSWKINGNKCYFEYDQGDGTEYTYEIPTDDKLIEDLKKDFKEKESYRGVLFFQQDKLLKVRKIIEKYVFVQDDFRKVKDFYSIGICEPETSFCERAKISYGNPIYPTDKNNYLTDVEGKICKVDINPDDNEIYNIYSDEDNYYLEQNKKVNTNKQQEQSEEYKNSNSQDIDNIYRELPFKISLETKVNELATELSYRITGKITTYRSITVVCLIDNLIINSVVVNKGNIKFNNDLTGFPVGLRYGEKIEFREDLDQKKIDAIQSLYSQEEGNINKTKQLRDNEIIEIIVSTDKGNFKFNP